MSMIHSRLIVTALLTAAASTHVAAGLLDSLKDQAAGYAMPALGSNSVGNMAGVLQYCVKNNYLAGDAASVKDKLMGKITGQKPQQVGYASGVKGLLQGGDGKSLNLKSLTPQLKEKACDYVLKHAGSLV